MAKEYCTQNDGDCETCSLVNYGRDCANQVVGDTSVAPSGVGSRKPGETCLPGKDLHEGRRNPQARVTH